MENMLDAIAANTAKIAEKQPTPTKTAAERIQFAFYLVNAPKNRLRDPEVIKRLAKIASKFDKVNYTSETLSPEAARQAVVQIIDFVYNTVPGLGK